MQDGKKFAIIRTDAPALGAVRDEKRYRIRFLTDQRKGAGCGGRMAKRRSPQAETQKEKKAMKMKKKIGMIGLCDALKLPPNVMA